MNLYLLQPINEDQPEWALSAVHIPVQVMADDEAQARHTAAEQLGAMERLGNGEVRLHNPWMRVDRVRIERIDSTNERLPLLAGYMPHGKRGRPSATSLYVLTPIDRDAEEWTLSVSQEPVCVEARHEPHARAIAAVHFGLRQGAARDKGLVHPWWSPQLVKAEKVAIPPAGMEVITARSRALGIPSRTKS